jgi:N-acyl-D-amino-acid deacylase
MIDRIIAGASIFDGDGGRPIEADVAIVGDRIALIGRLEDREALERIDGTGLALSPGFVDVHSHSDERWLVDGRCESKVAQGVTTEIAGNCGTSAAPLAGPALAFKRDDARPYGLDVDWRGMDEFLRLVESSGVGCNVATLVGLGTTRRCVRGDAPGPLDAQESAVQTRLVTESVEQGALGVSSGLIYTPSRYAGLEELTACAAAARAAGAPRYATHLRNEGATLVEAVEEALDVARRADVAVQFSHHKAAGRENWGKVHRSLATIDAARAGSGIAAAADVYPYTASWTDLATILPGDVRAGDRDEVLARLADEPTATAVALRLALDWGDRWSDILISYAGDGRNAAAAGVRLDALAREWRVSPPHAALRLLREERLDVQAMFFTMNEDDVATVLSAPFCCIGSDASARSMRGPTARGVPHPRAFGCFPRVIGRFVRGRKTLELPEAIRRMTSLPAALFGLRDRGRIARGSYADLILFDPASIVDTATYDAPCAFPRGIAHVWVNGRAVVRDGMPTGALPGRVLRGGGA